MSSFRPALLCAALSALWFAVACDTVVLPSHVAERPPLDEPPRFVADNEQDDGRRKEDSDRWAPPQTTGVTEVFGKPVHFAVPETVAYLPHAAEVFTASDVEEVDYYVNGSYLGTSSGKEPNFAFLIEDLPVGEYTLEALAFNNQQVPMGGDMQVIHVLPDYALTIASPVMTNTNPVTFKADVAGTISSVDYFVDGTFVGQSSASADGFKLDLVINPPGQHTVTMRGYDAAGVHVVTTEGAFELLGSLQAAVTTAPVEFISPCPTCSLTPGSTTLSVSAPEGTDTVAYHLDDGSLIATSSHAASGFAASADVIALGAHTAIKECSPTCQSAIRIRAQAYDAFGFLMFQATSTFNAPSADLTPTPPPQENVGTPTFIQFTSPSSSTTGESATFAVAVSDDVQQVQYYVDGTWMMGASVNAWSDFSITHTFSQGGARLVEARALDAQGLILASVTKAIHVTLPPQTTQTPPPSSWGSNDGNTESSGEEEAPSQAHNDAQAPSDLPWESTGCTSGETKDCLGSCVSLDWLGDDYCDDGSAYAVDFNCAAFDFDEGDCDTSAGGGLPAPSPTQSAGCPSDKIEDCDGVCAPTNWVGDDICDYGNQQGPNFNCEAFGFDEGDCAGPTTSEPAPSPTPNLPTGGSSSATPFFCQWQNALHPGSSCQNTSVAMVLSRYGWSGTPDTITSAWGKNTAQSPAGLAQVFNSYASSAGIPQRLVPHVNGSVQGLRSLLAQGKPVITHGYFTGYGHVVVVTGFTGSHYTVNDPAGVWSQSFQGGYPTGCANGGQGIAYEAAAFEAAVGTSDGASPMALWYHEVLN